MITQPLRCALLAAARAEAPTVQADQSFQGIGYSLSSSGQIVTFAGPREIGGKLAICGLVYFENASSTTRALEKRFAELIQFKIAGKSVHVATGLFIRYPSEAEAKLGKAGCAVTTRAWDPAFATAKLEMRLPNQTVRY